jgi:hypothetical protein
MYRNDARESDGRDRGRWFWGLTAARASRAARAAGGLESHDVLSIAGKVGQITDVVIVVAAVDHGRVSGIPARNEVPFQMAPVAITLAAGQVEEKPRNARRGRVW